MTTTALDSVHKNLQSSALSKRASIKRYSLPWHPRFLFRLEIQNRIRGKDSHFYCIIPQLITIDVSISDVGGKMPEEN